MSSSASDVVSTTTGIVRRSGSALMSASTSLPSRRGRLRSSRIRPGRGAFSYSPSRRRNRSACSPSVATCNELRILWCAKASWVINTSPASSSTSSTSITLSGGEVSVIMVDVLVVIGVVGQDGKGEAEPGPGGDRGVQPDLAPVILDELPAHGQPDAGARVGLLPVQSLEDHEDTFGVLGCYPDSVVGHGEQPETIPGAPRGDVDVRRVVAVKLQRVGH